MEDEGPSLPSNYVTILHLKEQWLKQQQSAKSNPNHRQPDSQSPIKPKDESTSKIPNESVYPRKNRHRIINPKPDVAPHDSASKIPNEVVPPGRNRHRVINQFNPDVTPNDSASKTVVQVADNHSMVETQEKNTDQPNSKPSTTKNSSRGRNPRFVTNQIPTSSSTPTLEPEPVQKKKQHRRGNRNQEVREPKGETPPLAQYVDDSSHNEPEPVQEKKQHRYIDGRQNRNRNRNQEVREPKGETTPFAQNVDDSSHNEPEPVQEKKQHRYIDGRRNQNRNQEVREPKGETPPFAQNVNDSSHNDSGVVEAVDAAVKEIRATNVSQRTNRRYDSGRFHDGPRNGAVKPPFRVKKEQTTAVWVKKGESSLN